MNKSRQKLCYIIDSRAPTVVARLLDRDTAGRINAEPCVHDSRNKPSSVIESVRRIFQLGETRLSDDEWQTLFATRPGDLADPCWALLARLATKPIGDEGRLREQFVALPDGTAFSMRLILLDQQGGDREATRTKNDEEIAATERGKGSLPLNRLADVVRMVLFLRAKTRARAVEPMTPIEFTDYMAAEAWGLLLQLEPLTTKDVTDRLFAKIKKNGGEFLIPALQRVAVRPNPLRARPKPGRNARGQ